MQQFNYESLVLQVTNIEEFTPERRNQFVPIFIIISILLNVYRAGSQLFIFFSFLVSYVEERPWWQKSPTEEEGGRKKAKG